MELTLRTSQAAPARSEQALVAAARRGDDRAFEELYASYRQRIFAFIMSKVHDHGRAEDIAQEVFMSALRRLRSSEQEIAFKPWIYEIAKNACIDEFRRGSRSREVPFEAEEDLGSGQRPMISLVPTPSVAVETKQRLDDLRGAFGGLSETHHQLLVMREFEGLSYDEIGERLGMTRQMVESSLFRARRKLSAEYDDLASGRRCAQIQTAVESGAAQSIRSLGVREQRRVARHLAHCQTCRHTARLAGVDEALLKPRGLPAKIAALLPFPLWRWIRRGGGKSAARGSGARHIAAHGAARVAQPAGSSLSIGQAAAAVAALAIAGAGAGVVTGIGHQHSSLTSSAVLASASGRPAQLTPGSPLTPFAASAQDMQAAGLSAAGATLYGGNRPDLVVTSSVGSGTPASRRPHRTASGSKAPNARQSAPSSVAGPAASSATGAVHSGLSGVTGTVRSTVSDAKHTLGSTVTTVTKSVGKTVAGVGGAVDKATHPVTAGTSTGRPLSTVGGAVGSAIGGVTKSGSTSASTPSGSGDVGAVTAPVKTTVKSTVTGILGK